jgi:hypothetical protein
VAFMFALEAPFNAPSRLICLPDAHSPPRSSCGASWFSEPLITLRSNLSWPAHKLSFTSSNRRS